MTDRLCEHGVDADNPQVSCLLCLDPGRRLIEGYARAAERRRRWLARHAEEELLASLKGPVDD